MPIIALVPQQYNPKSVQRFVYTGIADDGVTPITPANGSFQVTIYSGGYGVTTVTGPTALNWNAANWPNKWSLEIASSLFPRGVSLYAEVQILDLSSNVVATMPISAQAIY